MVSHTILYSLWCLGGVHDLEKNRGRLAVHALIDHADFLNSVETWCVDLEERDRNKRKRFSDHVFVVLKMLMCLVDVDFESI